MPTNQWNATDNLRQENVQAALTATDPEFAQVYATLAVSSSLRLVAEAINTLSFPEIKLPELDGVAEAINDMTTEIAAGFSVKVSD